MLSRVAESMYWMSRYIERAENTARFLDVNFHLLLDLSKITQLDVRSYWEPLIIATDDRERFSTMHQEYNGDTVSDFLVFNRNNPNSVAGCLALARENARSMIEAISSEMWEQINRLYHFINSTDPSIIRTDPYNFYREIKNGSHLFQGITDATLPRSEGWDFIQVGKYAERTDNTARLVDVKYHLLVPQNTETDSEVDIIQWMAVLKSCSALEAFRKVYLSKIEPRTVLQYLLLDGYFPRSIYFSVKATQEALWQISGGHRRDNATNADRLVGKLEAELGFTTVDDVYDVGLHNFLEDLEKKLIKIGDQIHQTYFAYQIPEQVTGGGDLMAYSNGRATWSQAAQQQQ